MGDGIVLIQIDLYDVLNSVFLTLTDSFGNFYSLSQTSAYMTVAVTNNYSAVNLMLRPPLTVLVTRLMVTTLSFNSNWLASMIVCFMVYSSFLS